MLRTLTTLLISVTAAGLIVSCGEDELEPGMIYEPCNASLPCGGPFECTTIEVDYGDFVISDASCTMACQTDADCMFDGRCEAPTEEGPLCYKKCFDDTDCPGRFACFDSQVGTDSRICLPW